MSSWPLLAAVFVLSCGTAAGAIVDIILIAKGLK